MRQSSHKTDSLSIQLSNSMRQMLIACAVSSAMIFGGTIAAQAADNNIVLASLSNTVPSDRAASNNTTGLFGYSEQRYSDIRAFTKWSGVLENFKKEFRNSLDKAEVQDWMKFLAAIKNEPRAKQIEAVNDYMNKIEFVSDANNYGVRDYWATPMEFMARGGDCEDYVMAKYISLRSLGFSENELRLAVVYDHVMRMPHALLVVYNEGKANILDNQNPAVLDSAEITRYKPIYSISQVAWWRH